jgi:hypothetical protein
MAANDDVGNSYSSHPVFDAGGHASWFRSIRRNNVPGIPYYKQLSGLALGQEFGYDAASEQVMNKAFGF